MCVVSRIVVTRGILLNNKAGKEAGRCRRCRRCICRRERAAPVEQHR